jgi:polyisoprenoid-binding protein YceI
MKTIAYLVLSTVLIATSACKKPDGDKPAAGSNTTGSAAMAAAISGSDAMVGSAAAGSADTAGSATVSSGSSAGSATDNVDHIVVLGRHRPAKPTDPVSVRFDKFRVVKASFDPEKIEGGTATIELDLASLRTGSGERDEDLKSPTYIDVGKFATVTIEIANVKKKADMTFTADATVKLRGVTKKYPVTFDVIEQRDDSIRIKGEHTFSRLDFTIGTDPAKDAQQQVDTELTIQMVVTLKQS